MDEYDIKSKTEANEGFVMDFDEIAMSNIEDMEFSTVLLSGDWHEIDDECWFDCDNRDKV